ncbi:MAG TPA: hypothetical protein VL172_13915 [Kofleriaceae bacterium]|jgi:hypothetical protein|nr:hypothetical protein [Kofleriaceae bacterium]
MIRRLDDRIGLPEADRAALQRMVDGHQTIGDVLAWGLAQQPALVIADVVVQDEYTHDVILPWRDGWHLVYDST